MTCSILESSRNDEKKMNIIVKRDNWVLCNQCNHWCVKILRFFYRHVWQSWRFCNQCNHAYVEYVLNFHEALWRWWRFRRVQSNGWILPVGVPGSVAKTSTTDIPNKFLAHVRCSTSTRTELWNCEKVSMQAPTAQPSSRGLKDLTVRSPHGRQAVFLSQWWTSDLTARSPISLDHSSLSS